MCRIYNDRHYGEEPAANLLSYQHANRSNEGAAMRFVLKLWYLVKVGRKQEPR